MVNHKFTFIDLFSGIGGFHLALSNLGGNLLHFSEINKDAIGAYCNNYNVEETLNLGDITKVLYLPQCDILTAGVPCQSWSIAGKNLGFKDDRGQLWNDTIYLLNQSKPKAFIFENVKGLADPRNKEALDYILERIKESGYFAKHFIISSSDYGIPQSRVRLYIIGFREESDLLKFKLPEEAPSHQLFNFLDNKKEFSYLDQNISLSNKQSISLSSNSGFNDYFLFNDLRGGETTIHSWDIIETTEKQKSICLLLLKNRRKKIYGPLDGNPLSLELFKSLDATIEQSDLNSLVDLKILKEENYLFEIIEQKEVELNEDEVYFISTISSKTFIIDDVKNKKKYKLKNINVEKIINDLIIKEKLTCKEVRYDFKNTKISTGIFGINRIVLPNSNIFPTLVASGSNDFIATKMIYGNNMKEYKHNFLEEIYKKGNYRSITKEEACRIQGFPSDFILPEKRNRWMKLIGNSVSVPVIEKLASSIIKSIS